MQNKAFLILGSNIEPEKNILLALTYLDENFTLADISNTWITKPVGSKSNDFLNTAVSLLTGLDPYTLKENWLCHIEESLGRIRVDDKNAPRTIDLDIVIFNDIILDNNIFKYDYMIFPFAEIISSLIDPDSNLTLSEIAKNRWPMTNARIYKRLIPLDFIPGSINSI
jgi:2-amino-4-hydroxy-6-hydroxymethyldihydropteridine diphosphokinase